MRKKTTSRSSAGKAQRPAGRALPRASRPASSAGVVLLSGGNPQIPKGDGDGPVRAYLDAMPGWKQGVGRRLDALITAAVPGVQKVVRWNSPLYGVPGRGFFLGFHCLTKSVKVAFFRGASLSPGLTGTPKSGLVRYLDIREAPAAKPGADARQRSAPAGTDLNEAAFVRWVQEASAIDGWDLSSKG